MRFTLVSKLTLKIGFAIRGSNLTVMLFLSAQMNVGQGVHLSETLYFSSRKILFTSYMEQRRRTFRQVIRKFEEYSAGPRARCAL